MQSLSIAFALTVSMLLLPTSQEGEPRGSGGEDPSSKQAEAPAVEPETSQPGKPGAQGQRALQREQELLQLSATIGGELAAMVSRGGDAPQVVAGARRILAELDRYEATLLETDEGRRYLVRMLMRVAEALSAPEIDARTLAIRTAQQAVALVEGAPVHAGGERAVQLLVGELHAGRGRIALVRGNLEVATAELEQAAELLTSAGKGRGTGMGSGEQKGSGTGEGKGRRRGGGLNKVRSLAEKRSLAGVFRDLETAYARAGNTPMERGTITRERQVVGNICQVESGAGGLRYGQARGEMGDLIHRLADATSRDGDPADAVRVQLLARQIWREVSEGNLDHTPFLEAVVEQQIRLAHFQADERLVADLRETASQTAQDLQVLAQRGVEPELLHGFEARLAAEVGRGLQAAGAEKNQEELGVEATNWFSRSLELIETIRAESGSVTQGLLEVEAAASRHLAAQDGSGR